MSGSECVSKDDLMKYLEAWLEVTTAHIKSMRREFSDEAVAGLYIWCDLLSRVLMTYIVCSSNLKASQKINS